MRFNRRPRQGLEPTLEELQSGAGCELVAARAHNVFQQGDYATAYHLLWEAIASAAVLITVPTELEQVADPTLRQQCLKRLRAWGYIRESQARTLRAFQAVRDWLADGTTPANHRAQEALSDEAELRRLYKEAHEVLGGLKADLPE